MSEQAVKQAPALIDARWLAAHIKDPDIRILDASYFVPGGIPPAREQYAAGHIEGAQFFDINAVADSSNPKEHAFPSAAVFAEAVGKLGIGNQHHVIAYDHLGGTCAAARVWFMFRAFGHARVSVLDGGRDAWHAAGQSLTAAVPSFTPEHFAARDPDGRVKTKTAMLANIEHPEAQVVDARSAGRFTATEPEPRPGLRSGHIPGSRNVPFLRLIDPATKTWQPPQDIAQAFTGAGIDLARPVVATCGSGVSACALALGAFLAGKDDVAIYDGSWLEWGADPATPIVTGPA